MADLELQKSALSDLDDDLDSEVEGAEVAVTVEDEDEIKLSYDLDGFASMFAKEWDVRPKELPQNIRDLLSK